MPLSVRHPPYTIPEYSLTGDLLAYLTCPRQYRYYNQSALPPAKPVQLWFGEFIHGVLHEAFLRWRDDPQYRRFPWDWATQIRPIELEIYKRLSARSLNPPPNLFCPHDNPRNNPGWCDDDNHPHMLIASERAAATINTWGQHLFPMIDEAEVKLTGSRPMPAPPAGAQRRSNYYSITGIVDVVTSVGLLNAPPGNLLVHRLQNDQIIAAQLQAINQNYDVIVDYKGMRRPRVGSPNWIHHEWQLRTYAWLREKQHPGRVIGAGIIFYINELSPSTGDISELIDEVRTGQTDAMPQLAADQNALNGRTRASQVQLSDAYKEGRSIRIIPITAQQVGDGLREFDQVVDQIETAVASEMRSVPIQTCWGANPLQRTCTACDFKTYCPQAAPGPYQPTVP